jgi:hypothetical protein
MPMASIRLEAIVRANRSVFAALAETVAAGWQLHIVPGNHDMELSFRSVQADLIAAMQALHPFSNPIVFDPWIYLVRGTVYAEHGHQYHDINAFGSVLVPSARHDPDDLDHPLGAYLDAARRLEGSERSSDRWLHRYRTLRAFARGGAAYGRSGLLRSVGRRVDQDERSAAIRAYADEVGLGPDELFAIDAVSRRGVGATLARAGRYGATAARERLRALTRGDRVVRAGTYSPRYLHEAAEAIHSVLASRGDAVPFYVFGHSHVAERVVVRSPDGMPASVLGTGTWTSDGPKGAVLLSRRSLYPWVEVVGRGLQASGTVHAWDARAERAEVLA